ncbi:MAG: TetR/AcrR family transcriptional regulator [Deltaproteobacteria bacterium]|nr:TetR/AcrR family transcriptional regulator [Deltaproteobacteria bacterium]
MPKINSKTARKNKIIESALKIFAEKGFADATISEISKAAGVSDATVYEYFNTKEELLFTIPEEITEEPVRDMEKILPFLRGSESKLRAIVQGYMTLYEKNPLYSALVMLHLKTNRNFLKTKSYDKIRGIAHMLLVCIQEGIDNGSFKKETDPYLVRAMILGTIEHLCIRWHLLGSPSNLVEHVDPLVDMILCGIRAESHSRDLSLHIHLSGDTKLTEDQDITIEEPKS